MNIATESASQSAIEVTLSLGEWTIAALLVTTLIAVHLIAPRVARLPAQTQDRLASIGGGAAVAYVFVHLMPELAEGGKALTDLPLTDYAPTPLVESGLFLLALVGMVILYSVEIVNDSGKTSNKLKYNVHLLAFAVINMLYAYTMPSLLTTGIDYAIVFTFVIAMHALLGDRILARTHPNHFTHQDRWVGILGAIVGFALALFVTPLSDLALAIPTALLGGGLLMTTFREELPAASKARLLWFLIGAGVITALLLVATAISAAQQ